MAAVCGRTAVVRLRAEEAADSTTGRRTPRSPGTGVAAVGPAGREADVRTAGCSWAAGLEERVEDKLLDFIRKSWVRCSGGTGRQHAGATNGRGLHTNQVGSRRSRRLHQGCVQPPDLPGF